MTIKPGDYVNLLAGANSLTWRRPKGEPEGVEESVLQRHRDGSYSHLLRIETGVEFTKPVTHEFYEEAYYVEGEMLNTRKGERIKRGDYVFHRPGEPHGPFRCIKTCLILEFRYYRHPS